MIFVPLPLKSIFGSLSNDEVMMDKFTLDKSLKCPYDFQDIQLRFLVFFKDLLVTCF